MGRIKLIVKRTMGLVESIVQVVEDFLDDHGIYAVPILLLWWAVCLPFYLALLVHELCGGEQ